MPSILGGLNTSVRGFMQLPLLPKLFVALIPLLLILGGSFTLSAYHKDRATAFQEDYRLMRDQVQLRANAVEGSISRISEAVVGVAEAIRAGQAMSQSAFSSMADALISRHPSVSLLAMAQAADEKTGTGVTEKNWLGEFVPAAARSRYLPITLLFAPKSTTPALASSATAFTGYDLASDDSIRAALAEAGEKGVAVSDSALVKGQTMLVYRIGPKGAQPERYLIAEVNIPKLLGGVNKESKAEVRVFDISDASGDRLLYSSQAEAGANTSFAEISFLTTQRRLEQLQTLEVLGKTWALDLRPLPSLFASRTATPGLIPAVLGTVATLLSALLIYSIVSRGARVERLVVQRSNELEVAYRQIRESEMITMQSEKMSALGTMIAGVAHEINTPLGFVTSNVQFMQESFAKFLDRLEALTKLTVLIPKWSTLDQTQRQVWYDTAVAHSEELQRAMDRGQRKKTTELVDETIDGLDRISELVVSLKDFSRVDRAPVDDTDIHNCIRRTLVIAHNQTKFKAQVLTEFGDIPHVRCNPSQINQVLLNLITNAAQAIQTFGKVTIRTANAGDRIRVDVVDNGDGIPAEIQQKIFEPFFTTKDIGKGTGLGLAICNKIIADHGGRLWVKSAAGKGSTFSFELPILGAPEAAVSGDAA